LLARALPGVGQRLDERQNQCDAPRLVDLASVEELETRTVVPIDRKARKRKVVPTASTALVMRTRSHCGSAINARSSRPAQHGLVFRRCAGRHGPRQQSRPRASWSGPADRVRSRLECTCRPPPRRDSAFQQHDTSVGGSHRTERCPPALESQKDRAVACTRLQGTSKHAKDVSTWLSASEPSRSHARSGSVPDLAPNPGRFETLSGLPLSVRRVAPACPSPAARACSRA
jgi:hypothetical protein